MPDTPEHLAGRLAAEGMKTQEFFNGISADQWDIRVYSDGAQWTLRQTLTHFVSSEESFTRLFENILVGGEGAPEGFDIDVYNERKVLQLQEMTIAEKMERFKAARQRNIELVSSMTADDLLREAGVVASTEADPISDITASAEYRRDLLKVLVARVGKEALARAKRA